MEENNMKNKNEKLKTKRNYSNCVGNYNYSLANPCGSKYCYANRTKPVFLVKHKKQENRLI